MNTATPSETVLTLTGSPIIAQGTHQYVYEHPQDPTSLIKFRKPEAYDPTSANLIGRAKWHEKFRYLRSTAYQDFLREFREYVELKAKHQQADARLPLCAVRGVIQTDIGMGLVYERMSEPDGSLSPNLEDLIKEGQVRQHHLDAFEAFFDSLLFHNIVGSAMTLDNLVYHTEADGQARFVWIDSFGSKRYVPLRRWFRFLNNKKIEQARARRREPLIKAIEFAGRSTD